MNFGIEAFIVFGQCRHAHTLSVFIYSFLLESNDYATKKKDISIIESFLLFNTFSKVQCYHLLVIETEKMFDLLSGFKIPVKFVLLEKEFLFR